MWRIHIHLFLALLSLLLASIASSQTVVNTTSGLASSSVTDTGITIFRGIPYAVARRFERAKMANYSQNTVDASNYGPACVQLQNGTTSGSEDCLSVNIWAPSNRINTNNTAAVFVWIYGGGFVEGMSSDPYYDLTRVATFSQDVVFVSFNYRVGPFGFLTTPESGGGNWGLTDQILALQWVQQNIGAFGGDSTKVTIMGQSAGSISVCLLVNSPLATGLFRGAIMDEGPCGTLPRSLAAQQSLSAIFVNATGCAAAMNSMECLRSKSVEELMIANYETGGTVIFGKYGGPMWLPCVDSYVIPTLPLAQMARGSIPNHNIVVMTGTTFNSMTIFMLSNPSLLPQNFSQLQDMVTTSISQLSASGNYEPAGLDAIKSYYLNLDTFQGSVRDAAAAYLSDSNFVCGTWREAALFANSGILTHFWVFNYTSPCFRSWGSNYCPPLPDWVGAFHGSDLAWWFNSTVPASSFDADLRVSMMGALRSFVKTQNPNPMYLLEPEVWNPQDSSASASSYLDPSPLIIKDPFTLAKTYRKDQCSLWNSALTSELRNLIPGYGKGLGLSRFAIIGIAIGSIFVFILFAIITYFAVQSRRLLANPEFLLQEVPKRTDI